MRIVLGWLFLLALFGAAGALHGRWRETVRRERQELRAEQGKGSAGDFETSGSVFETSGGVFKTSGSVFKTSGRARLRIGRPSGAPPLDLPEFSPQGYADRASFAANAGGAYPSGETPPPDWTPPVYEMTVQAGQVLSVICEDFYGSGRPPIPDQVAAYNGLPDANSLRAGQTLFLPPLTELRGSNR